MFELVELGVKSSVLLIALTREIFCPEFEMLCYKTALCCSADCHAVCAVSILSEVMLLIGSAVATSAVVYTHAVKSPATDTL